METETVKRRSIRTRQSVSYDDSAKRTTRKSVLDEKFHEDNLKSSAVQLKTPKKSEKLNRKAADDSITHSPKKLRLNRTPSSKALESVVSENSPTINNLESPSSRPVRERKSRYSDINLKINVAEKTVKRLKDVKNKEKNSPEFVASQASSDDEEKSTSKSENVVKLTSSTLFDDAEDVEGKNLFSFRTPKKKDSMALLAQNTPKTPRHNNSNMGTPRTPKNNRLSEIQNTPTSRPSASKTAKTPRHVREANKKSKFLSTSSWIQFITFSISELTKILYKEESDGDLSTDASDTDPDNSSSDDSTDSDEPEAESPPKKPTSVAARILKTPSSKVESSMPSTRRSMRNKGDFQYVLKSDDYFSGATTKAKTSDHTLDRLKNPRLPHDQLIKMLSNMELSKEHELAVKGLNKDYKKYFNKWLTLFDEGYTVLLHGFGSKRNLLQNFHKEKLATKHVIVINGFFPSLTIKEILDSIWVDLLEQSSVSGNPHETVNMIEEEMKQIPALHLFLIVHNIDGTMLRNAKAQNVLSRLASIKNLHMIASIDHINTPLRKFTTT